MQNVELAAERDELIGRLKSVEEIVKQRESELVHVHQQYQILYQQFAALQIHYSALEQRLKVCNMDFLDICDKILIYSSP
jgi:predicted nuclease with TOPRIM domain